MEDLPTANHKNTAEKFWSNVLVGSVEECWPFLGWLERNGYGRFKWNGLKIGSHRLAYKLGKGEIPFGYFILHKCDNKSCCNPDHLYAGTAKQNSEDAKERGLLGNPNRKGSHNGGAKLNEEIILKLRQEFVAGYGKTKEAALRYGVSESTIRHIVYLRGWV